MKKNLSSNTIAFLLVSLMFISSLTILSPNIAYAQQEDSMTFTSGEKIDFNSDTEMTFKGKESMQFWSGEKMKFGTNITIQFIETMPDGVLVQCDWLEIIWSWPPGYVPHDCEWWEVIDPVTGEPLGEFHVDFVEPPNWFHIDIVWPGPIPVPVGGVITAKKKIDVIQPCEIYVVHWPEHWWPVPCTWWEIIHPETGELTGYEFHVDWTNESCEFHIDEMIPGPYILDFPWYEVWARRKIPDIKTCDHFVVEEPEHWWPEPCTWWEIMDPWTGEPTGYNFHVDWTNESCEFHIDMMDPGPYAFDFPVPYVIAEKKIEEIKPCDWFIVVDPIDYLPDPCSWWEVLDDTGAPTDLEFHVDVTDGIIMFHVDITMPGEVITIPPSYTVTVRKKIDLIQPCDWFRVDDVTLTPELCSWWEILDDTGAPTGIEFHVDETIPADGLFHIDQVFPEWPITIPPTHMLTAEKKIDDIQECDWFKVLDPPDFVPEPCSWWVIIWPSVWAGTHFHVDANDDVDMFHIDDVNGGGPPPPPPSPPPWNVTAIPYEPPPLPWYVKAPYPDYAPSGMPDFDQRQGGTYIWKDMWDQWSHCGPVAVANSIWWYDSQYEYIYNPGSPPPPTYSDSFPLVQSYGGPPWDDHDPLNVPPLVEHLAWLMDCDAQRTGPFTGAFWSGTYVHDMEAGLAQYLSWTGVNPLGDCNGDGVVDPIDEQIVMDAMGSVPGSPFWNLAADIYPASTTYPPWSDQVVDMNDLLLVQMSMSLTGMFTEETFWAWEDWEFFWFVEEQIEACQDVVLLLGMYIPGTDYREFGHYVTCAGVNSTTMELLISNPIRDDYEAGMTPGRSPVPHVHPPPEPPYITHNNASLVSQDAYTVLLLPSPSGYHFMLDGYHPAQDLEARIEYAVITCPLGQHDVAVINVTTCKDGCVPMPTVSQGYTAKVNVTVLNEGDFTETFDVTVYADSTVVGIQTVNNLGPGSQTVLTFSWDTTGFAIGNYTIKAVADTVPGEADTSDNTFIDGIVKVTIVGDVNGDDKVDMKDIGTCCLAYGSYPGHLRWNPNADINDDDKVDMKDIGLACMHYGESYP